ncbi:hypothetical protein BH24ACT24_BH24ACT24_07550 [soil metagenome]
MAGVEWRDEPLDRAALARGVPALEEHAHRRSGLVLAEHAGEPEPELEQSALRGLEALGLLVSREREGEVEGAEAAHLAEIIPASRPRMDPWLALPVAALAAPRRRWVERGRPGRPE